MITRSRDHEITKKMKTILTILTILSSFLANLEQKTLQTDFTVAVAEEVNAPMNYPGFITIHGRLFTLRMFDLEAAYDGQTMYLYSANTDELTLSNPTDQELVQTNPFLFAQTMVGLCNTTERTASNGEETIISLTPKDQSAGINRFVLRVRNDDLMPLSLEIKEGKKTTSLKLTNPRFVVTEPKYTLEPEPTTFVNDMRF